MPILIPAAVIPLALATAVWLVIAGPSTARVDVVRNLDRGKAGEVESQKPKKQIRVISGAEAPAGLSRFASPAWSQKTATKLAHTGVRSGSWTVDKIISAKLLLTGMTMVMGLAVVSRSDAGALKWLIFAAVVTLSFFLPEVLIHNRATKRKQSINLELPDVLDQMSVAVAAGLGFDSAMLKVASNGDSPLSEELVRTMQDLQFGKDRSAAYEDLSKRTGSIPLRKFTRAIARSASFGLSLTQVLASQADEMRDARRQDAERRAASIPVKITMPLMLFIMPVLFIVVLGPAILTAMVSFGSM